MEIKMNEVGIGVPNVDAQQGSFIDKIVDGTKSLWIRIQEIWDKIANFFTGIYSSIFPPVADRDVQNIPTNTTAVVGDSPTNDQRADWQKNLELYDSLPQASPPLLGIKRAKYDDKKREKIALQIDSLIKNGKYPHLFKISKDELKVFQESEEQLEQDAIEYPTMFCTAMGQRMSVEDATMIGSLCHGTKQEIANKIQSEGFILSKRQNRQYAGPGIYFANSRIANAYATSSTWNGTQNGEPAIVKARLNKIQKIFITNSQYANYLKVKSKEIHDTLIQERIFPSCDSATQYVVYTDAAARIFNEAVRTQGYNGLTYELPSDSPGISIGNSSRAAVFFNPDDISVYGVEAAS